MASPKAQGRELHKAPDARRKSLRPFSITTALNTLNRMVHAPADRPALRISSPVLISSSNPSVAAAGSEDAPRGTPAQVRLLRDGVGRAARWRVCDGVALTAPRGGQLSRLLGTLLNREGQLLEPRDPGNP